MIRSLLNRIIRWGLNFDEAPDTDRIRPLAIIDEGADLNMEKAIRFAVLPANGGCVVETRILNTKAHEWDVTTHIIPDGQDIAKRVGEIVALEFLRR